jgi:hypothetical protein
MLHIFIEFILYVFSVNELSGVAFIGGKPQASGITLKYIRSTMCSCHRHGRPEMGDDVSVVLVFRFLILLLFYFNFCYS